MVAAGAQCGHGTFSVLSSGDDFIRVETGDKIQFKIDTVSILNCILSPVSMSMLAYAVLGSSVLLAGWEIVSTTSCSSSSM